jgi:hypothetical protein
MRTSSGCRAGRCARRAAVPGELLRVQLNCALANAQVDRPNDFAECPLFAPGATSKVVEQPHGAALQIDVVEPVQVEELWRRLLLLQSQGAPAPAPRQ